MTEFKWFRSLSTGKVGKYPAHFASRPSFVEVDSEDATCIDCLVPAEPDEDELVDDEFVDDELIEDHEDAAAIFNDTGNEDD